MQDLVVLTISYRIIIFQTNQIQKTKQGPQKHIQTNTK